MAAIVLGLMAYDAANNEIAETRRATEYANQPVLIPVHEASAVIGSTHGQEAWFPAKEPYMLSQADAVQRVFRIVEHTTPAGLEQHVNQRAIIYLKNVGQGPAILTNVAVWNASSQGGTAGGTWAIGPGEYEMIVIDLEPVMWSREAVADWRVSRETDDCWDQEQPGRLYFLEVDYDDIFESVRRDPMRAWFDPNGRGRWKVVSAIQQNPLLNRSPK